MKDTFWQTIDEWSTGTDESAMFHQYVPNHEDMLAECIAYNGYNDQSSNNIGRERKEYVWSKEKNAFVETDHIHRYFATPTKDHFPVICEFLESNQHQYFNSQISMIKPGGIIIPHVHKNREQWLFNMSLNFPNECRFAVYPTGLIPYRAGDVYKLRVENFHSVINESDTDRYHIMMKTKETMQSWGRL